MVREVSFDEWRTVLGLCSAARLVRVVIEKLGLFADEHHGNTYWESEAVGVAILFESEIADTVFLFGGGKDDFERYGGELPSNLDFDMDQKEVRDRLGEPVSSGSQSGDGSLGFSHGGWDRFLLADGCGIHCTYEAGNQRLCLLSLSVEDGAMRQ